MKIESLKDFKKTSSGIKLTLLVEIKRIREKGEIKTENGVSVIVLQIPFDWYDESSDRMDWTHRILIPNQENSSGTEGR